MNRTTVVSVIAAGALLLAGCSSQEAGTPSAASSPTPATAIATDSGTSSPAPISPIPPSPAATTSPTLESSVLQSSGVVPSQGGSSEPGTPGTTSEGTIAATGDIDASSMRWITTFCTGFSKVAEYTSPDTTGMGKQDTIDTVVDAYQGMSDAASDAAGKLQDIPDPTFRGGEALAGGIHHWFVTISKVYGQGSSTIANGSYASPDDLTDAIDSIEAKARDANETLSTTVKRVEPTVSQTMAAMPECSALLSGR